MKRLFFCLSVLGMSLLMPAPSRAIKPDPLLPPYCRDVCWAYDPQRSCLADNGTTITTCFYYMNA